MKRPKVGDIFKIPLSDGRYAFGQYLLQSKVGPIIQVYERITRDEINLDELSDSELLFPPVIVGLFAAIRDELWVVVGHRPVTLFEHPKFLSTNWNEKLEKLGFGQFGTAKDITKLVPFYLRRSRNMNS